MNATRVRAAERLVRALVLLGALAFGAHAQEPATPEAEALRAMDAFMAAFNARDVEAWIATLNFPHVRLASGQLAVFRDPAEFRNNFEFARFAAQTGWSRSEWTERRVIHAGADKVHVAVVFTRFREDGSVLAKYDSLYVVTKQSEHWGVQARSSYAP